MLSHIFQINEKKYFSNVLISFIGCQHSKKNKKNEGQNPQSNFVAEEKPVEIIIIKNKKNPPVHKIQEKVKSGVATA